MKHPGILLGALVGLLVSAPLVVISALANQLAGLPFVPYDLFPFVRNIAPGRLLIAAIELMAETIRTLNLGRVDTTAKIAEQFMTMLLVVAIGVVAAAIFFAVVRSRSNTLTGIIAGLILGVPIALICATALPPSATTGSPALNGLWIVILFVAWGWTVNWAHNNLFASVSVEPAPLRV